MVVSRSNNAVDWLSNVKRHRGIQEKHFATHRDGAHVCVLYFERLDYSLCHIGVKELKKNCTVML